ncbi:MAG: hypothetical protein PF484_07700 [Bacteroidales bacterium]|jgi:hypothetical protein|nr:hypothetical protein [Bacteroidales bacterium]
MQNDTLSPIRKALIINLDNTLALCEITLNNLLTEGEFSEQDFLDFSSQVLKLIHENNPEWENMVPKYVSEQIKEKHLFGYQLNTN